MYLIIDEYDRRLFYYVTLEEAQVFAEFCKELNEQCHHVCSDGNYGREIKVKIYKEVTTE